MPLHEISDRLLDEWRRRPIHPVLRELGLAAQQGECLDTRPFRRLVAYLLEIADGRDRRESWVVRTNVVRPVPKLRVLVDDCYARYGELQWFRLNKSANATRLPLLGLFPRIAASFSRVATSDVATVVEALISDDPDAGLMAMLHERGGKIRGMGLDLFSRIAYAFRPDLYFLLPRPWAEASGLTKMVGNDLRKYLATCRTLRQCCDDLGLPAEIRATVTAHLLALEEVPEELRAALDAALGKSLVRHRVLSASDADRLAEEPTDRAAIPTEFAANAIRSRRGDRGLRDSLCRAYRNRCAISGDCPKDLLEVAYVATFPTRGMHEGRNAILMRSDLHTLWDLNLIGIDPSNRVRVAKRLRSSCYGELDGRPLLERADGSAPSPSALRERWSIFHESRASDAAKTMPQPEDVAAAPASPESIDATATAASHRADPVADRPTRDDHLSPSDSHSGTVVVEA